MKKQFKIFLSILLCLSLVFTSACANNTQKTSEAGTSASSESSEENTGKTEPGDDGKKEGSNTGKEEDQNSNEIQPGPEPEDFPGDYKENFVAVRDADPGMTLEVTAPADYTKEQVLQGVKLSNLSNPLLTDPGEENLIEPDYLEADGGNGAFTLRCKDGFNPGDVYQVELTDEALCYQGQDPAVRFYNITTTAPETNQMRLKQNISHLDAVTLTPEEREQVLKLDGVFRYDPVKNGLDPVKGRGTFTGNEGAYRLGEIVAVFEGENPGERNFEDTSDRVAYIKITEIADAGEGKVSYHYEGAAPEEVLFTPEVIPVKEDALLPSNEENTVTLKASDIRFTSDGKFSSMGLDENSEPEPGDFLAFYTGSEENGTVTRYAEVVEVAYNEEEANGEDTVSISYKETELQDMMSSVDIYREYALTQEQVALAYDEEAVKSGIMEDLTNNGCLLENTYQLAKTALETEEAKKLFQDVDVKDLTFYYGENEAHSMTGSEFKAVAEGKGGNAVDIKGDPDIRISPNIVHFAGKTGYGTGVRAEVYSKFIITIKRNDTDLAALKITLTFFFEAELVLGFTVDATSVWKWAWIFPYLYDYNISGSIADGIYTGAGFSTVATLIKNEKEKTEEEKAAGIEWPEGVDQVPRNEMVLAFADYIKEVAEKHDAIFPAQTTGGGSLQEKYRSFIISADKSFVDIINENIFDWNGAIDPLHIIAFRLKGDFVVSGQLNVAIGIGFNYERAYKETFSFLLFHQEGRGNKVDETDSSAFRADFYLFGALGLRAGIRITAGIGLFDARLDSVGLELEGGLYTRFWGFFYGGYSIQDLGMAGESCDAYYEGGMLAEAGVYYSVTFFAQAGDGAISTKRFIDGGEYPFISLGNESVVSDFAYKNGEKTFSAVYPLDNNRSRIPEDIFTMQVMAMKDGTLSTESRGKQKASELYEITFDDPDFAYEYADGSHFLVKKNNDGGTGQVTMTLKWKGTSFEQLSVPLVRTFVIPWTSNETTLQFLNFDGSVFHAVTKTRGEALTEEDLPDKDPTWPGCKFDSWVDPSGQKITEMPKTMPQTDTVYTSSWEKVPVPVKIEYYMPYDHKPTGQALYYLSSTDLVEGIFYTDDEIADVTGILREHHLLKTEADYQMEGKEPYQHYRINTGDSELSVKSVDPFGGTTFKICLEWDAFTITFDDGAGNVTTAKFIPGMAIDFPQVKRQGYDFVGWMNEEGEMITSDNLPVSTRDETYTAVWKMIPPTLTLITQVKVKSWGITYFWKDVITKEIVLDKNEVTVEELLQMAEMPGYTYDPASSGRELTDTVSIAPDGTTRVILRFK